MPYDSIKAKDLLHTGQHRLTFETAFAYETLPLKTPVVVDVDLRLTDTGLTIAGTFEATVEEPCDRCLAPFERHLSGRFEDRYVYANLVSAPSSAERELHEDDFFDVLGPEGFLDIKDLIRQHLVLHISTDRVCNRPDCVLTF